MGAAQPMTDTPHPETGISQETRDTMYPDTYSDKYNKVFKQFIDDVLSAQPVAPIYRLENNDILIDEKELIYEAHMTIGGQQNRFNASVIRAAINCIKAI